MVQFRYFAFIVWSLMASCLVRSAETFAQQRSAQQRSAQQRSAQQRSAPVRGRPKTVKVAAVQIRGYDKGDVPREGFDPTAAILPYIDRAGEDDAQLLAFPEYVLGRIQVPGPETERIGAAAARNRIYVIVGCWEEFDDGTYANTALIFDRSGNIAGKYRKTHAAVDQFEGEPAWSKPPGGKNRDWFIRNDPEWTMQRGGDLPVFNFDFGRVGVLTCYDGWFPESFRVLSLKGAEILVWINGRGGSVEDFIVQSVMFQSHVGMVCTNQAYGGGTMIGDVPARILKRAADREETYLSAQINLSRIRQIRQHSRNFQQRRPDLYGVIVAGADSISPTAAGATDTLGQLPFTVDLTVARKGFDPKFCWVHARAGAVPAGEAGENEEPLVVMTLQKLQLSGSDVFFALNEMTTGDRGATWTEPKRHESFARRPFQWKGKNDLQITVCDFSPRWHAKTRCLLGTGQTVVYENNRVMHVRPRGVGYAVYDTPSSTWSPWKTVEMPAEPRFENCGAGSAQRFDLPNGNVLVPVYFKVPTDTQYSSAVMRCSFDGKTLAYLEHGNEMTIPVRRGLFEPSVTQCDGRYFLTLRNDLHGYVAVSDDGLNFTQPKKWTFDDGTDLGNYNTQQHWVAHGDDLFLVYTRRGAGNDHVFRHRAPLFIARVDIDKLQIVRSSERILVPEKGARLGNFGVTDVGPSETWVTVTEWMQGPGSSFGDPRPLLNRGAENRIWVAKLKWNP